MIVLDTNVVSALMQEEPDQTVARWLDRQPLQSLWIASISIFEIRFGIEVLEKGRRQQRIEDAFERALLADFEGRILMVDEPAAREAATLAARRRRVGHIIGIHDTLIAGIAVSRKAELATRNMRHFDDLDIRITDPWSQ